jgi:hypothetical protein
MAWRYVRQPNGKLAVFSEVVDDFIEANMDDDQALAFYIGKVLNDAREKIGGADRKPGRFEEALEIIKVCHGQDEADTRRKQLSDD